VHLDAAARPASVVDEHMRLLTRARGQGDLDEQSTWRVNGLFADHDGRAVDHLTVL
jgi:hypothetical protein